MACLVGFLEHLGIAICLAIPKKSPSNSVVIRLGISLPSLGIYAELPLLAILSHVLPSYPSRSLSPTMDATEGLLLVKGWRSAYISISSSVSFSSSTLLGFSTSSVDGNLYLASHSSILRQVERARSNIGN